MGSKLMYEFNKSSLSTVTIRGCHSRRVGDGKYCILLHIPGVMHTGIKPKNIPSPKSL